MDKSVFSALKCDFCDGPVKPDKESGLWKCQYCGTEYTKTEIKEMASRIEISGQVEFVRGNAEKEKTVQNAETMMRLMEFSRARKEFESLVTNYPDDCRGWLGLFRLPIENYFFGGKFDERDVGFNDLDNACRLGRDEVCKYFDHIISTYGNRLHTVYAADDVLDNLDFKGDLTVCTIDDFTKWMLCDFDIMLRTVDYEPMNEFLDRLSMEYYDALWNGQLAPYDFMSMPDCVKQRYPNWRFTSNSKSPTLQNLLRSFGCKIKYDENKYIIYSPTVRRSSITIYPGAPYYVIGRWLILSLSGKYDYFLLPRPITVMDFRKFSDVCVHCGAPFKGLFTKVCSNPQCAKPKDY